MSTKVRDVQVPRISWAQGHSRIEWDFVEGLQFMQQIPEDADFVKLVYQIRLKKVRLTLHW